MKIPRSEKWIGAHLSAAKGPQNAIIATHEITGNCCALFLKNQRSFRCPPPFTSQVISTFTESCLKHGIDPATQILPHGSYLVNLANPSKEKSQQMYSVFLDDLKRCEALDIGLYNFHPGSAVDGISKTQAISSIAQAINQSHKETESVVLVLESMAGQGQVVGGTFGELAQIIELVQDQSRIGVCLDTCHLWAAGYDIGSAEGFSQVMQQFDSQVGLKYLRAMHLNDSVAAKGSHKDRHANIGKGQIGIEAFRFLMNSPLFDGIPMVLETPASADGSLQIYRGELELLRGLVVDDERQT